MKTIAFTLAAMLLAAPAHPQDFSRVLPNGSTLSVQRTPGVGITVSKEGPHLSWSHSVGHTGMPSASATATASDPNFAFARASTSASSRTNANGMTIDHARARGVAIGQSTSTSAVTRP
jgi:hypothetical protein